MLSMVLFIRFVLGGSEDDWICEKGEWIRHGNPDSEKPLGDCGDKLKTGGEEEAESRSLGIVNPAAVYCKGRGGKLEMVRTESGEDANCIFADGLSCGQWEFLRGECGREHSYCVEQGGQLKEEGSIAICILTDGSQCDEYSYFSGSCEGNLEIGDLEPSM